MLFSKILLNGIVLCENSLFVLFKIRLINSISLFFNSKELILR